MIDKNKKLYIAGHARKAILNYDPDIEHRDAESAVINFKVWKKI